MIFPARPQTSSAVAAHYDELDQFYREIWGEHVHHGVWTTGRESVGQATEALVDLVRARLRLTPGLEVCDIGCGYGATAQRLAEADAAQVTGLTLSEMQAEAGRARRPSAGRLNILQQDWLANGFPDDSFDRAYAIESSEHMADKQGFFDEAFRTLKPGGRLVVCAWLARADPRPWEVRHLLEPICREGRLPSMGDEQDYNGLARQAGFRLAGMEDISQKVRRTWGICARRLLGKLASEPRYRRYLLNRKAPNRIFALTLVRIMMAYRTGSMRYGLFAFDKPAAST